MAEEQADEARGPPGSEAAGTATDGAPAAGEGEQHPTDVPSALEADQACNEHLSTDEEADAQGHLASAPKQAHAGDSLALEAVDVAGDTLRSTCAGGRADVARTSEGRYSAKRRRIASLQTSMQTNERIDEEEEATVVLDEQRTASEQPVVSAEPHEMPGLATQSETHNTRIAAPLTAASVLLQPICQREDEQSGMSDDDGSRKRTYACRRCGQPKKGHICTYTGFPPSSRRSAPSPLPTGWNAPETAGEQDSAAEDAADAEMGDTGMVDTTSSVQSRSARRSYLLDEVEEMKEDREERLAQKESRAMARARRVAKLAAAREAREAELAAVAAEEAARVAMELARKAEQEAKEAEQEAKEAEQAAWTEAASEETRQEQRRQGKEVQSAKAKAITVAVQTQEAEELASREARVRDVRSARLAKVEAAREAAEAVARQPVVQEVAAVSEFSGTSLTRAATAAAPPGGKSKVYQWPQEYVQTRANNQALAIRGSVKKVKVRAEIEAQGTATAQQKEGAEPPIRVVQVAAAEPARMEMTDAAEVAARRAAEAEAPKARTEADARAKEVADAARAAGEAMARARAREVDEARAKEEAAVGRVAAAANARRALLAATVGAGATEIEVTGRDADSAARTNGDLNVMETSALAAPVAWLASTVAPVATTLDPREHAPVLAQPQVDEAVVGAGNGDAVMSDAMRNLDESGSESPTSHADQLAGVSSDSTPIGIGPSRLSALTGPTAVIVSSSHSDQLRMGGRGTHSILNVRAGTGISGAASSSSIIDREDVRRFYASQKRVLQQVVRHGEQPGQGELNVEASLVSRKETVQSALYEILDANPTVHSEPPVEQLSQAASKLRAALRIFPTLQKGYVDARCKLLDASMAMRLDDGNALLRHPRHQACTLMLEHIEAIIHAAQAHDAGELLAVGGEVVEHSTRVRFCVLKDALTYRIDLSDAAVEYLRLQLECCFGAATAGRLPLQLFPAYVEMYHELFSTTRVATSRVVDATTNCLLPDRRLEDYLQPRLLHTANAKTIFDATAPNGKRVVLKKYSFDEVNSRRSAVRELRLLHKFEYLPGVLSVNGYFLETVYSQRSLILQLPYLPEGHLGELYMRLRCRVDRGEITDEERLAELLRLFSELAEVLMYVHAAGVSHRDVKPSNVLIEVRQGRPRPVLADFETGVDEERRHLTIPTCVDGVRSVCRGTPGFRPPEALCASEAMPLALAQQSSSLDTVLIVGATDVWALGAMILYETLLPDRPIDAALEHQVHRAAATTAALGPNRAMRLRESLPELPGLLPSSEPMGQQKGGGMLRLAAAASNVAACSVASGIGSALGADGPSERGGGVDLESWPSHSAAAAGSTSSRGTDKADRGGGRMRIHIEALCETMITPSPADRPTMRDLVGTYEARAAFVGGGKAQVIGSHTAQGDQMQGATTPIGLGACISGVGVGCGPSLADDAALGPVGRLQAAIDEYRQSQRGVTRRGKSLPLPFRMAKGVSARTGDLRTIALDAVYRRHITQCYMADCTEEIEATFFQGGGPMAKAIAYVAANARLTSNRNDALDFLPVPWAGPRSSVQAESLFWEHGFIRMLPDGAVDDSRQRLLERLLRSSVQDHVYAQMRSFLLMESPQKLFMEWEVCFDGESRDEGGAIDAGGPHCVALQLFCSVFAERFLENGVVSEHKARAVMAIETLRSPGLRCDSPCKDFEALGRLLLHCRARGIPSSLGLCPLIYRAAFATIATGLHSDSIAPLNVTMTLDQLLTRYDAAWCEQQLSLYQRLLRPYHTDSDRLLESLSLAPNTDLCFEYSDGQPLCANGGSIIVDCSNAAWYKLLWLRRHLFGAHGDDSPTSCPTLVAGLRTGLETWGKRVFQALGALSDADIVSELEGCLRITPQMFLSNVRYANSARACDKVWFERAVEATEDGNDQPVLSLPSLLMFFTGMSTFRADQSLRPAKEDPSRQHMLIIFDPNCKALRVRTCFYELYLPHYSSYEELLANLKANYQSEGFDHT